MGAPIHLNCPFKWGDLDPMLVSWSLTSLFSTNMFRDERSQFIEDTVEPSVFLPGIISLIIMCIGII